MWTRGKAFGKGNSSLVCTARCGVDSPVCLKEVKVIVHHTSTCMRVCCSVLGAIHSRVMHPNSGCSLYASYVPGEHPCGLKRKTPVKKACCEQTLAAVRILFIGSLKVLNECVKKCSCIWGLGGWGEETWDSSFLLSIGMVN